MPVKWCFGTNLRVDSLPEAVQDECKKYRKDEKVRDQGDVLLGVPLASKQMTHPRQPVVQPANNCSRDDLSKANDAARSE